MTATLDPIDFEVLRHRLWMINDEQGRVAAQVSGSPAVYEAKDFNTSLLTPEGESLYVGIYTTRLSLCLNFAVRTVIERLGDAVGIEEGDAFVTNDPWCGAAHMNDILMVAPIFWEGRLVCWAGLAMHETDVGGPNPGSFTVGTPDVFGEGPLIPTIKMVERGRIREDLEALVIRNSRTSEVNGLNLRARIAAINRTRERIREMIAEYGVDTFMALQSELLRNVGASFARRVRALPDGSWRAEGFLDHDGNENRLYRVRLQMTKTGETLEFDYTGTDRQARGAVNCTRVGLESGTVSAVLPMLCYDMPWSPGAIMPAIRFVSEEGTLNNATHPAAVSMATVAATFATSHVASQAIGKMLACSDLAGSEAQASWSPAWQGATLAGRHEDGRPFTAVLLDQGGGGGARAWKDGPDTGGLPGTPAMGIANVETYEKEYPILYVYRRQSRDTGGAGRYRGGVGTETMLVPHRADGPIDLTLLTHGASQPEAQGLYGGYPSSVQVRALLRGADIRARFRQGEIPAGLEDAACEALEPQPAKTRTVVNQDDAWVIVCAGGGGYGDALLRPPQAVADDIRAGLCSREVAEAVYGVALDGDGGVDAAATGAARQAIRARRLAEGRRFAEAYPDRAAPASGAPRASGAPVAAIGQAVTVAERGGALWYDCRACRHPLAPVEADPKTGALVRAVPMEMLSPWNRFGLTGEIAVNEYVCPGCAHLLSVEVRRAGDPPLLDTELRMASDRVRDAAE
ncbi:MAG: hydantoinase B/oxoprolinase family protein [Defluviicoccus sp.]|nr:hydantoinase B/oxoprolinase family protein [Defluviicoccus sp.]